MAIHCGFFNEEIKDDRLYSPYNFDTLFDGLIADGINPYIGERFNVSFEYRNGWPYARIGTGAARFNGVWIESDEPIFLQLQNFGAPDRKDAIVLEVNNSIETRDVQIGIVNGDTKYGMMAPEIVDDGNIHMKVLATYEYHPDFEYDKQITNFVSHIGLSTNYSYPLCKVYPDYSKTSAIEAEGNNILDSLFKSNKLGYVEYVAPAGVDTIKIKDHLFSDCKKVSIYYWKTDSACNLEVPRNRIESYKISKSTLTIKLKSKTLFETVFGIYI